MGALLRDLGHYLGAIALISLVYIGLGWLTFIDRFMPVYYYRSVFLLIGAMVTSGVFLWLLRWRQVITMSLKDIVLSLCFGFLLNFSFLSLVTVSLDRSISVYLISYMAQHADERFSQQDIETVFLKGYVEGTKAMQRRIEEQMITGTLVEHHDGTYSISERGEAMVAQWRLIAKIFRVDNRFLYSQDVPLHSAAVPQP